MWNAELAAAALDFALMCRLESNPDRASQVPGFDMVGENLSAVGTSTPDYTRILETVWFGQRVNYDFDQNSCTSVGACLFYTQVTESFR